MENAKRDLKADYLRSAPELRPFYRHPFTPQMDYNGVIQDRRGFPVDRNLLVGRLIAQNKNLPDNEITLSQIESLKDEGTFTVTTGHQLCLMGGPLYTIYKIVTAIKLAREIQSKHPDIRVVPVFWMATEDHDWEEINHFFPGGNRRLVYGSKHKGAAGRHILEESIQDLWPPDLPEALRNCYAPGETLAASFRRLIHHLFGQHGLVIIDGDDPEFKKVFIPWMHREVGGEGIASAVRSTNEGLLQAGYEPVAQTRDLNLFYLGHGGRSGLILENELVKIPEAGISWTKEDAMQAMHEAPVDFSPNVVLRPLYQEVLLPNLAYVGGWAEMAYWMQLKQAFESSCVAFPLLVPRMHGTLLTSDMNQEAKALGFNSMDFKRPLNELQDEFLGRDWDGGGLSDATGNVLQAYLDLVELLEGIDPTLAISMKGEMARAETSLENLLKKVRKSLRNKNPKPYNRLAALKYLISPDPSTQERVLNFTAFGPDYAGLIASLLHFCNPEHPQNEWISLP